MIPLLIYKARHRCKYSKSAEQSLALRVGRASLTRPQHPASSPLLYSFHLNNQPNLLPFPHHQVNRKMKTTNVLSLVTFFAAAFMACVRASNVVTLTTENFDQIIGQGKPALVEFYASWCGHVRPRLCNGRGILADESLLRLV